MAVTTKKDNKDRAAELELARFLLPSIIEIRKHEADTPEGREAIIDHAIDFAERIFARE